VHGLSTAGKPLLVRYDLDALARALDKETLARRDGGFWRYREFLPVRKSENAVSLGEVMTPLISMPRAAARLGVVGGEIIVKDEGRLPTGSFKARGLALAVAMAKELGLERLAMPTNGNAGAAMAAYASQAGLKTTIFCPDGTPEINVSEIKLQGADVYKVNGLINDCGKIVGDGKAAVGWFDCSTLKEPYRIEGKKTMGLELAEQMGWRLPDVIFYPTGGGQPGDSGTLKLSDGRTIAIATTVKGGEEDGADAIVHVPAEDGPAPAPGDRITAEIDWTRRHRHMRAHTCLHLLSAVLPYPVTGGSIGDGKGRLDFDIPEAGLDKEEITAELNRLIGEDHPVAAEWISDDELAAQPELVKTMSVKPPTGAGQVRLIRVEGLDLQPCGGTHVAQTGEIGPVTVTKIEKKGRLNRRVSVALND